MKIPEEAQSTRHSGFRIGSKPEYHLMIGSESACGEIIDGKLSVVYPNIWPEPRCDSCARSIVLPEYLQNHEKKGMENGA